MSKLTITDTVSTGDLFVIEKANQSDFREVSGTDLLAWIQSSLTYGKPTTQYYAPAASGFTATITDGSEDIHLILTPLAGYAAGTIKLPALANAIDKQIVTVNCTQSVAALTMDGNGATVVGAPTALSANGYFVMKYDIVLSTWYRIG